MFSKSCPTRGFEVWVLTNFLRRRIKSTFFLTVCEGCVVNQQLRENPSSPPEFHVSDYDSGLVCNRTPLWIKKLRI